MGTLNKVFAVFAALALVTWVIRFILIVTSDYHLTDFDAGLACLLSAWLMGSFAYEWWTEEE